jgi:hypothetical protein
MNRLNSYTLGDNFVTPEKRLSAMLTQQGSKGGPSLSWQETMGRIAQQLMGGYLANSDQKNLDTAYGVFGKKVPNVTTEAPTYSPEQVQNFASQGNGISRGLRDTDVAEAHMDVLKAPVLQPQANTIQEENIGPAQPQGPQQGVDGSGWNQMPDFSGERGVHDTNTYAGIPNADPRAQIAELMAGNQTQTTAPEMSQRDYMMQQLQGLENNPYAKRLLAQLTMQGMDRDYTTSTEQALYERGRKDDVTDRDLGFQNKIDVKTIGQGTGPFKGNSEYAQNSNILINGDPSSPIYRAAYNQMSQPKTSFDPKTGRPIHVTPNMSAYRPPTGVGAGTAPQAPGQPTVTMGEGDGRSSKYSDVQNKASGFYGRMLSANEAMEGVLAGADGIPGTPDDVKYEDVNSLGQTMKNAVPLFGNNMISNDKQQLQQAQENWVSAVLRRESGAVLGEEEIVRENKKYFPQYGDSKETIAQKALARKEAEQGMLQSTEGAWEADQEKQKNKGQRKGEPNHGWKIEKVN